MVPWYNAPIAALTLVVMLVGLFGMIVPVFPGILVIWLAALLYGLITGFTTPGIIAFIVITLLMIAGATVDNVLMGYGARRGGASWVSILLGEVAGIVGTIFLPPFGGLIAAPAVVMLLEFLRKRDLGRTWRAFRGLAIGWGLSFVARALIGVVMIALWGAWVWLR